jgi:hypothetical protein
MATWLSQSDLLSGLNVTRRNQFGVNFLGIEMTIKLNVFCVLMKHRILGIVNGEEMCRRGLKV